MSRRPTISALSSFSTLPSMSSINFFTKLLDRNSPMKEYRATLSGSTLAEPTQSINGRMLGYEMQDRASMATEQFSGIPAVVRIDGLVQQAVRYMEVVADDRAIDAKKKRSLVRAVKKAGMSAAKKLDVSNTWRKRRSKLAASKAIQDILFEPRAVEIIAKTQTAFESVDSLVVECGSPEHARMDAFPMSPTLCVRNAARATEIDCDAQGSYFPPGYSWPLAPINITAKLAVKPVSYTALVALLAFLLPTSFTLVVVSIFIGIGPRLILAPTNTSGYPDTVHPFRVVAVGVLTIALWSIGETYPGLGPRFTVSLLATLIGRTLSGWGNLDLLSGSDAYLRRRQPRHHQSGDLDSELETGPWREAAVESWALEEHRALD